MNIAVVIPSYKVTSHILDVISGIGEEVTKIYVVDDCCPDASGEFVKEHNSDPRVEVLHNEKNKGVGGAVMHGYKRAIEEGMDVIVKIDGDGQMDPSLIPLFVGPILRGEADYTKGNRFYRLDKISAMPKIRLFGNAVLSFMTKISSGYWNLFDPTNGYTAIHANVAKNLPFEKISERYFFESDMLFRLNSLRAVVADIPMDARYEDEVSNLKIKKVIFDFLTKNIKNFFKRVFYNYYLRDMSLASLEFPLGLFMFLSGAISGLTQWIESIQSGVPSTSGTVMLSALPMILGLQLLLAFIGYDINNVPKQPIHKRFK